MDMDTDYWVRHAKCTWSSSSSFCLHVEFTHSSQGKFVLGLLLFPPGVILFTPIYICYVILTSVYNIIWPEWVQDENEEKTFLMFRVNFLKSFFVSECPQGVGKGCKLLPGDAQNGRSSHGGMSSGCLRLYGQLNIWQFGKNIGEKTSNFPLK